MWEVDLFQTGDITLVKCPDTFVAFPIILIPCRQNSGAVLFSCVLINLSLHWGSESWQGLHLYSVRPAMILRYWKLNQEFLLFQRKYYQGFLYASICSVLINRPGVARAVLKTPSLLIKSLSHPFPPDLQNMMTPKPLELGSWNFETMFTTHNT